MVEGPGLEPRSDDYQSPVLASCTIPPYFYEALPFFILHIYYNIFFYKNQLRFLVADSGFMKPRLSGEFHIRDGTQCRNRTYITGFVDRYSIH